MTKSFRYIFAAAFAFILGSVALTAHGQINDTWVLTAAGNTAGASGTRWTTDLYVFNPHEHKLWVKAVFIPSLGGQPETVIFEVFANENFAIVNALDELFERTGTGAILLATFPEDNPGVPNDVLQRSFLVTSRTFNNASTGTYGQAIRGELIGLLDVQTDGVTAIAQGIRESGNNMTGFRTNVGAVNLGKAAIRLHMRLFTSAGILVSDDLYLDVPPEGHVQDRLPLTSDRGTLEFWVSDPLADDVDKFAVVFPYVSIIDNRSGDPTYGQPVLLEDPEILWKDGATAPARGGAAGFSIDNVRARQLATASGTAIQLKRVETPEGVKLER